MRPSEMRNSRGDILYQHDRDAPPQEQVVPFEKVAELDTMMKRVIDEGTGGSAPSRPGRRRHRQDRHHQWL